MKGEEAPFAQSDPVECRAVKEESGNLALHAKAYAFAEDGMYTLKNVTDGEITTRWAGYLAGKNDIGWIYVDLGNVQKVDTVKIHFETACSQQFKIQVSNDAEKWTDVAEVTDGHKGENVIGFEETEARYVKMQSIKAATEWGLSIWEFEVYRSSQILTPVVSAETSENSKILLKWTPACMDDEHIIYQIYRDDKILESIEGKREFLDNSCETNVKYTYIVKAVREGEELTVSYPISYMVDTNPPTIPQNVTAQVVSENQVDLQWSASEDASMIQYYVYRDGNKIAITRQTEYQDTSCSKSAAYSYTVKAVDEHGNLSGGSNIVTVKTSGDYLPPESSNTVYPEESNEVLLNPGKGWVLYAQNDPYDPNNNFSLQTDETWEMATTAYNRFAWSLIEPEEGKYDWSVIDNMLAECRKHGKKLAFGIMNANVSSYEEDVPAWVWEKIGPDYTIQDGKKILNWESPEVMELINNYVSAMGERYNGNPDIAFIDVRNFGVWGEWHGQASDEVKRQYVDMYGKAFPDTQLMIPINSNNVGEAPPDYAKHGEK